MFTRLRLSPEKIAIIIILLIGAFFRLYRISEYMTFLGDEGRDARVVSRIITDFDLVLIGPMTSVTTTAGHMYLGPAYYYLMVPFMAISNLSPVGPSVMVALFSLATIVLIWWAGRQWFHPIAGLIAASLYAISPVVLNYAHSSWNPNIMPFFALLSVWALYQTWRKPTLLWLTIAAVSAAVVLQSHYLGLLLFPVLGVIWLASFLKFKIPSFQQTFKFTDSYIYAESRSATASPETQVSSGTSTFITFLINSLIAFAIFLLLMSPLLIFDLRHDWLNYNAFKAFFTERQTTVNLKFYKGFTDLYPMLVQIYGRLLTVEKPMITHILLGFTGLATLIHFWKFRMRSSVGLLIVIIWLITGLIGLTSYKQHVYDHYFGFLFPVPFLLSGWLLWQLFTANGVFSCCFPIGKSWGTLVLMWLIIANLRVHPFSSSPHLQLHRTQEISQKIMDESQSRPFNLGMIAKSNYDESYRFFLEKWHTQLVAIDPQKPETITDQLFVVCETQPCNPVGHPQTEIASFGWAKITGVWAYPWGHTLFKLEHAEATPSADILQ